MKQSNIKLMLCAIVLYAITLSTHAMQTIKMRNALDATGQRTENFERMSFSVFTTNKDIGTPRAYRTEKRGAARQPYAETTHIPLGGTIDYPVNLDDESATVWIDYQGPFSKDPAKLTTSELKKIVTDKNAILEFYFEGSASGYKLVLYRVVSIPPAPQAPRAEFKEQKEGKASDAAAQSSTASPMDTSGLEEPSMSAGSTPQTGGN